jgi:hypothetical protein
MTRRGRETEGGKLRTIRESELKRRDKARLRELAQKIAHARATKATNVRQIRGLCKLGRQNLRAQIKALRSETRDQLRRTVEELRRAQATRCADDERVLTLGLDAQLRAARDELVDARRSFAHYYGRKATRSSAKERREESADEVAHNLPAELVPVFRRVERSIHGGPRRSRTEAFLEWVEENPDQAHAIMYEQAERDVARLIAEHEATGARLAKAKHGRGYRDPAEVAAALAGVPF